MSEIASLLGWDTEVNQLVQMRDRLRRHPQYPAAAQRLAANLLRDADEDPSLNAMLRDAGHNVAALSAIYLHASGEVSLPRLQAFIAGFGLVSPGRARAMLNYMRHLDYLKLDAAEPLARRERYHVTPQFLASYRRHEASLLDTVHAVEPAIGLLLQNLAAPEMLNTLVTAQGDAFVAGSSQARPYAVFYRVFLHRLAGIQILHSLVARAQNFPPDGDLEFSISDMARRFKVSKVHVGRIMKDAEGHGFLTRESGSLRFTQPGLEALDWLYASRLCLHLACAARVLRANPRLRNCVDGSISARVSLD